MVEVKNVFVSFGERKVLNDISLTVGPGEILAIMGTSGGGKTTLLRSIAGLINIDSGTIEVDGINVQQNPEGARKKMGMVFQGSALFDFLSVRENILFGVKRQGHVSQSEQDEIVQELVETVGLVGSEDFLPSELSGGMKKRVGLARALALKPTTVMYDEPVTGLDPITAYTIDELIANVRKRYGVTSIVVSHDLTSVYRVADQVAFLENGSLSFLGTTQEFQSSRLNSIQELLQKAEQTKISD